MKVREKWYIYFFESGYRTGVCRLTPKEVKEIEKTQGDLMKKEEA